MDYVPRRSRSPAPSSSLFRNLLQGRTGLAGMAPLVGTDMPLEDVLRTMDAVLGTHHPLAAASLRPGIGNGSVDAVWRSNTGRALPPGVGALLAWHDGMESGAPDLVPQHGRLLSLEEAIDEHRELAEWALEGHGLEGRFPLMRGEGSYLLVDLDGSVLAWDDDDPELPPPSFESVTTLCQMLVACFTEKAFEIVDDRWVVVGADHALVRALHQRIDGSDLTPWVSR